jgi:subtilase family serine protease
VDLLATMHLNLVLQRDPAVETAFKQLLLQQQDKASPLYHRWLTPQQIGELYGLTQADAAAIASWATTQGLTVEDIAPSRMIVRVTGTVEAIGNAFGTTFNYYGRPGHEHLALNSEPSLPAAFAGVARYIDGLVDLPPEPTGFGVVGQLPQRFGMDPASLHPFDTTGSGAHIITPKDFGTIYDIASVYASGNTGATIGSTPQHIAVIDRSDVASTDISEWAANVGITGYHLNTVQATTVDPGQTANGDQAEATADVNRTLGTAPGAITDLVVAGSSNGGIFTAASYNVDTLVDPVMTISFGGCEATRTAANVAPWDTLFQTGAAEGITSFVSAGDAAAAGCAADFAAAPATTPVLSVNYLCASTYVTCVGGTEFNDTANASQYWATANSSGLSSALSYIPEGAWNEPTHVANGVTSYYIQGGSGGASVFISKPGWQTSSTPTDGARDEPDIAFTAALHDGYYSCLAYAGANCAGGYYETTAGTSNAAPAMAGITALLNTKAGSSQGNINPMLYELALTSPSVFHDVTVATSGVTNCSALVASMCNNSTPSPTGLTGGLAGYVVAAGYDQATGLGSLDVAKFLAAITGGFNFALGSSALSFVSGATTGNTNALELFSFNKFAGTVSFSCSVSASSAVYQPACAVNPSSVVLAANGTGSATVTISSTTATADLSPSAQPATFYLAGFGCSAVLVLLMPSRRRSWPAVGLFLASITAFSALSGCGSKSGSGSGSSTLKSSAGSYTVTVNATSGAQTASNTFTVVIN